MIWWPIQLQCHHLSPVSLRWDSRWFQPACRCPLSSRWWWLLHQWASLLRKWAILLSSLLHLSSLFRPARIIVTCLAEILCAGVRHQYTTVASAQSASSPLSLAEAVSLPVPSGAAMAATVPTAAASTALVAVWPLLLQLYTVSSPAAVLAARWCVCERVFQQTCPKLRVGRDSHF